VTAGGLCGPDGVVHQGFADAAMTPGAVDDHVLDDPPWSAVVREVRDDQKVGRRDRMFLEVEGEQDGAVGIGQDL